MTHAREWLALAEKVCSESFEEVLANNKSVIMRILNFAKISALIVPETIKNTLEKFTQTRDQQTLSAKEARLAKLNLLPTNAVYQVVGLIFLSQSINYYSKKWPAIFWLKWVMKKTSIGELYRCLAVAKDLRLRLYLIFTKNIDLSSLGNFL